MEHLTQCSCYSFSLLIKSSSFTITIKTCAGKSQSIQVTSEQQQATHKMFQADTSLLLHKCWYYCFCYTDSKHEMCSSGPRFYDFQHSYKNSCLFQREFRIPNKHKTRPNMLLCYFFFYREVYQSQILSIKITHKKRYTYNKKMVFLLFSCNIKILIVKIKEFQTQQTRQLSILSLSEVVCCFCV